jgi:hypothetical protein
MPRAILNVGPLTLGRVLLAVLCWSAAGVFASTRARIDAWPLGRRRQCSQWIGSLLCSTTTDIFLHQQQVPNSALRFSHELGAQVTHAVPDCPDRLGEGAFTRPPATAMLESVR